MAGLSPKLPLHRNFEDGYALNKNVKDLAKQNLKMIILTSPGERIMFPSFGVGIRHYLFRNANASTFSEMRSRIKAQVATYLPHIRLESVEFGTESPVTNILEGSSSDNLIYLQIKYSIPSSPLSDTLSISI